MNILLAASEVVPYAKTGGLADVAGALPKALARLGHRVRVVMPRYQIDKITAHTETLPLTLTVPFNFQNRETAVYVDRSGEAPIYFIDAPEYFSRGRLYGEPDDAERFAFFSRAVVEFAKAHSEPFDIIHLNDWMTGLVATYLKTTYANEPAFQRTRTLFTIHNLAFHGYFDTYDLGRFGLPDGRHPDKRPPGRRTGQNNRGWWDRIVIRPSRHRHRQPGGAQFEGDQRLAAAGCLQRDQGRGQGRRSGPPAPPCRSLPRCCTEHSRGQGLRVPPTSIPTRCYNPFPTPRGPKLATHAGGTT